MPAHNVTAPKRRQSLVPPAGEARWTGRSREVARAAAIANYWADRGYRIQTKVIEVNGGTPAWPLWGVRSDMIDGLPRSAHNPKISGRLENLVPMS